MKKECKPTLFLLMNFVLIFNLLTFWSIRSMWSGIISLTAKPVPYVLWGILAVSTIISVICNLYDKSIRLPLPQKQKAKHGLLSPV